MKTKLFNLCLLLGVLLLSVKTHAQVVINEVLPNGTVELKNTGNSPVDLSNYWLCDRPTYNRIGTLNIVSGDVNALAPGDLLVIDNFNGIEGAADEVALYNTNSFGSTSAIVDFVQWGAPSATTRAGVAVSAGIWSDASEVAPVITAGSSLQFNGASAILSTPADFFLASPSIGSENQQASQAYIARLSGIQENPSALTAAFGSVTATLTGTTLVLEGSFEGLVGDFDANIAGGAHVHRAIAGRNGGIEFLLSTNVSSDLKSGTYEALDNTFVLTQDQVDALDLRELYINIHTSAFPGGELRGQLLPISDQFLQTTLLGSNEVPSVNTTAAGNLLFELAGNQLTVSGSFDDLSGDILTALAGGAHIHPGFAGRNGGVLFPLTLNADSDNRGAIVEAASNVFTVTTDQITQLNEQGLYVNIHSTTFNPGELRGQIVPLSSAVFRAELSGAQEVPAVNTTATGRVMLVHDGNNNVSVSGTFNNLSSDLNTALAGGIHVHLGNAGINGGIEFVLTPEVATDNRSAIIRPNANTFALTDVQITALEERGLYVNVHSLDIASGELRGQLLPFAQSYLSANLSGRNEVQPVESTGVGNVQLELTGDKLVVTGGFRNLVGDFDANIAGGSHLHLGDASANGGIEILINATVDTDLKGGVYTSEMNTFTVTAAQRTALLNGNIYLNLHTTEVASGELRGQILRDDNAFPLIPFAITAPAADATIVVDNSNDAFDVSWDLTTDPNGDLIVYTYQLAADANFSEIILDSKVGASATFSSTNAAVNTALSTAGVAPGSTESYYQRILASDGSVSSNSEIQTINLTLALTGARLTGVDPATDTVTITNFDTSPIDVSNFFLCLGPGTYRNVGVLNGGTATILAGETLDLTYDQLQDVSGGLGLFSVGGNFGSSDPNILVDYMQYGAANQARVDQAVAAGRWDDVEKFASCPAPYTTVVGGSAIAWGDADGGTVMIDVAATGNPNNTTSISADGLEAVICVDGQADPLVVIHENPGVDPNISYRYVITDASTDIILNIVGSNTIDIDGAGQGTCQIWGWSYRGVPNNGAGFIGGPLSALDAEDCSDISDNAITVIREEADGGTVMIDVAATGNPNNTTSISADGLEAVICVDGQADPLVVIHENPGAENLSYRYVITDASTDVILDIVGSNTIDIDGAGQGTCQIWGWSYRGVPNNGAGFIGGPLSALDAEDCSDISDNAITVIREEADGGTVMIDVAATGNPNNTTSISADGLEAVICVDGQADPLVVIHENPGAENLSYRYVITDASTDVILDIVGSNTIDIDGAGQGTCQIWGWSYRGVPNNGAGFIGGPLSALDAEDCSDISDNAITVIREEADGGTVMIDVAATGNPNNTTSISADGLEAVICVDGQADPLVVIHENPGAENLSYRYVITDASTDVILDIVGSNTIDIDGAGQGTCQIWGWSYRGVPNNGAGFIGGPLSALDAEDCSDISDNAITVIREEADGGTVMIDVAATGNPNNTTSISADGLEAVICVDGQADPLVVIHENPGAENLSYRYVITDASTDVILDIVGSNTIDIDGAGQGTCQIWGWSYRGVPNNGAGFIGGPLSALDAEDCSDISDNAITVIREEADGGTVSLANGDTEVTICAGDGISDPLDVIHENDATNLTYQYVITDINNVILDITASSTIDLEGAGSGVCKIWGWSYRGLNAADFIGEPLFLLDAQSCSDISDDFVRVTRLSGPDCDTLSVSDETLEVNLRVYPNPVIDIVNISVNENAQNLIITVYDLTGKSVRVMQADSNQSQLNVSDLAAGVYLLEVVDTERNTRAVKQIIKR